MKALLVLLIALAAGAHAQQPAPCLKVKKIKVEKRVLHQNGATWATLTFEGKHCVVLDEAKDIGRQGLVFEIAPQPGISASAEIVGAGLFDPAKVRLADFQAGEIAASLDLRATPEAALGNHSLPVFLHYWVMDTAGNVHDETLAFSVPVKIVPAEYFRQPGPSFSERHPIWAKVLRPFEIIAIVPMFIVEFLNSVEEGC